MNIYLLTISETLAGIDTHNQIAFYSKENAIEYCKLAGVEHYHLSSIPLMSTGDVRALDLDTVTAQKGA